LAKELLLLLLLAMPMNVCLVPWCGQAENVCKLHFVGNLGSGKAREYVEMMIENLPSLEILKNLQ